jgi:exonuclease VII small subunit
MAHDTDIESKMNRIETIIARIEGGDLTVLEGKELLEEARDHIEDLEGLLDVDEE